LRAILEEGARELGDFLSDNIKTGEVRLPEHGVRVKLSVEVTQTPYPEVVAHGFYQTTVDWMEDDLDKPSTEAVLLADMACRSRGES
jgi:hypothetical protein